MDFCSIFVHFVNELVLRPFSNSSRGTAFRTILYVRQAKIQIRLYVFSRSLIRVFAGHSEGSQGYKASSGGQRRLIRQPDPCLRWARIL